MRLGCVMACELTGGGEEPRRKYSSQRGVGTGDLDGRRRGSGLRWRKGAEWWSLRLWSDGGLTSTCIQYRCVLLGQRLP